MRTTYVPRCHNSFLSAYWNRTIFALPILINLIEWTRFREETHKSIVIKIMMQFVIFLWKMWNCQHVLVVGLLLLLTTNNNNPMLDAKKVVLKNVLLFYWFLAKYMWLSLSTVLLLQSAKFGVFIPKYFTDRLLLEVNKYFSTYVKLQWTIRMIM